MTSYLKGTYALQLGLIKRIGYGEQSDHMAWSFDSFVIVPHEKPICRKEGATAVCKYDLWTSRYTQRKLRYSEIKQKKCCARM